MVRNEVATMITRFGFVLRNRFYRLLKRNRIGVAIFYVLILVALLVFVVVGLLSLSRQSASEGERLPSKWIAGKKSDDGVVVAEHKSSVPKVVATVPLTMIHNEEERRRKDEGFERHSFNALVSERIGRRREILDTRHSLCRDRDPTNDDHLPNTTVIICFYNEDYATLLRTIYTVLERTLPKHLLVEILLVDDHSDNTTPELLEKHRQALLAQEDHEDDISVAADYLAKVRLVRTPERAGLIRARIYGAQFTRGEVLFFLDSHCEVNVDWLPPLLERIVDNRRTIACPIIDLIDAETLQYKASPIVKGGLNWGLHFKWDGVPPEDLDQPADYIKPIRSPTMAGGLFAMSRDYFYSLGTYDRGMNLWGGENIELSLRVWMCGGRLEIVPCSRVGHIFRKKRPYGDDEGDTLTYNSLRVAHVWLDEYKEHFFNTASQLRQMSYGDVSDRVALRKKLNCSTFGWFLQNVYPELELPEQQKRREAEAKRAKWMERVDHKPPKVLAKFALQLDGFDFCLEPESEGVYRNSPLVLRACTGHWRKQMFKFTKLNELRLGPKACLEAGNVRRKVKLAKCHEMGGSQQWQYSNQSATHLYNVANGLCLSVVTVESSLEHSRNTSLAHVSLSICSSEPVLRRLDELSKLKSFAYTHWNLIHYAKP